MVGFFTALGPPTRFFQTIIRGISARAPSCVPAQPQGVQLVPLRSPRDGRTYSYEVVVELGGAVVVGEK